MYFLPPNQFLSFVEIELGYPTTPFGAATMCCKEFFSWIGIFLLVMIVTPPTGTRISAKSQIQKTAVSPIRMLHMADQCHMS
jgi:hypothetical protein